MQINASHPWPLKFTVARDSIRYETWDGEMQVSFTTNLWNCGYWTGMISGRSTSHTY